MQSLPTYLSTHYREDMPAWLASYQKGDLIRIDQVLQSRLLFYPGYGDDGSPVAVFNQAHSCHVFVLADYGMERERVMQQLEHEPFKGYRSIHHQEMVITDLVPQGWRQSLAEIPQSFADNPRMLPSITPFGFLELFEREEAFDDHHGAHRLAMLFLGADGIATYDALFCQATSTAKPWCTVLVDHGTGGNYSGFGADGWMVRIARETQIFPELLLVSQNTKPWMGYTKVADLEPSIGGMHRQKRWLYRLK